MTDDGNDEILYTAVKQACQQSAYMLECLGKYYVKDSSQLVLDTTVCDRPHCRYPIYINVIELYDYRLLSCRCHNKNCLYCYKRPEVNMVLQPTLEEAIEVILAEIDNLCANHTKYILKPATAPYLK
jgi:hypothetical protein